MPGPCAPALSDGQSRHIAPPCLSTPRTTDTEPVWLSSTSRCTPPSTLRLAGSAGLVLDRKSKRLNSSPANTSYAVFSLKKQHCDDATATAFDKARNPRVMPPPGHTV